MNSAAAHDFSYDTSAGSASGAAMLLILQILPQLQLLKNCRGGWKAIADTAQAEIEMLRNRVSREQVKLKQIEQEYMQRMTTLRMKVQRAYDEKHDMKSILLETINQLQYLQFQSKMTASNFSKEKENIMKMFNENNKYILNNKIFLKNVSIEMNSIILNNATDRQNNTAENNNVEHEIRNSLVILTNLVQKMRKEMLEKDRKISEITESNEELKDETKSCESSKEELQNELDDAKEFEEKLNIITQEKQQLQHTNENMLKQILSLLQSIATYNNVTLETILQQTSSAARDINKYIVEPTDEAKRLTLKSILKNRTLEDALMSAAKEGNLTEISMLLDNGADIEAEDKTEWKLKPLHWTSHHGHWNATRLLLLRGANVNGRSGFNVTALHMAVNQNHINVMDLLLKGGADIEAQNDLGHTPLFQAVLQDCATAKLLVDRGANVSTADNRGVTAVDLASGCVRELLCSKGAKDPHCMTENETATTAFPDTENS